MSKYLNSKIKLNTYKNIIYQSFGMLASFYLYPLMIDYLDKRVLGVWLTLMSIASWFMILDVGLSHGLRNKLAPLIGKGKIKLARAYLSSTYFYFAVFLTIVFILMSTAIYFSDLYFIFNIEESVAPELTLSVFIVMSSIFTNLFFTINFSLSNALQNASFSNFRNMLFNLSMVILLIIMLNIKNGTLFEISAIFFVSNLTVNLLSTYFLYKNNLQYFPSIKLISFRFFKENFRLGVEFFIINISSVIMFSTDTVLITHLLGADMVIYYSITLKAFTVFLMLLWFYTGPLWSAYSVQYSEGKYNWIIDTLKKSLTLSFILFCGISVFVLIFENVVRIWTGDPGLYNKSLTFAVAIMISLRIWNGNFSTLLNGLSLTKVQMYTAIVATILNIPLSIYFVNNLGLGLAGVAYGSAVSLGIFSIIGPFYSYVFLSGK